MTEQIALFVEPEHVEECILTLRRIDGVNVRLETKGLNAPETKEHGQYSLTFGELAPIVISVTGMLSSFVALATAIIQLRSQSKSKASNNTNPMLIVIGGKKINVTNSTTVNKLEVEIRGAVE